MLRLLDDERRAKAQALALLEVRAAWLRRCPQGRKKKGRRGA